MSEKANTYDYWTNEETLLVYKWITHDRASRRRWRARVSALLGEDNGPAEVNQAIEQMSREIRACFEAECCNHVASLSNDLFSCALARVVWREVAKVIISAKVPAAADFDWLFPFGNIVETPGVLNRIPRKDRLAAVAQHAHGNWGEVDAVDWSENDSALRVGEKLYWLFRF